MREFESLVRPCILKLTSCMSVEHPATDKPLRVYLDANENPYNAPLNRYTRSRCEELKAAFGRLKSIWPHCIALTNGTDEAIDFIFRIFCDPKADNVVAIAPTSRKYPEYALFNDTECRVVPLDEKYQISADVLLSHCDEHTKVIFLCSPNNPTGNLLNKNEIISLCSQFHGMVVIDEAYNEFTRSESLVRAIASHHNLIVLNTLSKAFASADLRLSIVYAVPEIIRYIDAITPHHHISNWTQEQSLEILRRRYDVDKWVNQLLEERRKVVNAIGQLPICEKVYPTDANFFLVRFKEAEAIYHYLLNEGIAVHNCSKYPGCENCLRITIGLPNENSALIGALRKYKPQK